MKKNVTLRNTKNYYSRLCCKINPGIKIKMDDPDMDFNARMPSYHKHRIAINQLSHKRTLPQTHSYNRYMEIHDKKAARHNPTSII